MCVYADLLEQAQGIPPETIAVVTGDRASHVHQLADYAAYYRACEGSLRGADRRGRGARSTRTRSPSTTAGSARGGRCASTVAAPTTTSRSSPNITRSNRRRLVAAGVDTLAELAELGDEAQVAKLPPRILERLRHQAALQLGYRRDHVLRYELIPPSDDVPGQGLAALPEPAPLDVFFDIEADPWALDDGLEYLLGWVEIVERRAGLPRDLGARPGRREGSLRGASSISSSSATAATHEMHVYHYGGYESGALKRLMQRHATREDEVDRLLRGRTLVDLYDTSSGGRSGPRSSRTRSSRSRSSTCPSARAGSPTPASRSWSTSAGWRRGDPAILDAIAAYNRDDCVSTWGLRDWLEERRIEAAPLYPDGGVPRPEPVDPEPTEELAVAQAETRAREDALREGVPADRRRADRRATGPLAARRPPRLASPRGEAAVVGLLPAARGVDR